MTDTTFFLLRRLHSLTGVFAVGAFLLEHLFSNAFIVIGPEAYNGWIAGLQGLPFLHLLEIVLIGLPLTFHAVYGVAITWSTRLNVGPYAHAANWRYTLQRATGILALVFIAGHVWTMRFVNFPADGDFYSVVQAELSSAGMLAWYVIGIASTVFHFANGLWTAAIVWGVTITSTARRVCGYACGAVGIALFAVAMATILKSTLLF